jgi:hypothetical protein
MSFQETAKNWEPPDGLGYSSLRPVRLRAAGIALAVLGVIFLIAAPVLAMVIANQSNRAAQRQRLLNERGVDATAVITRVWRDGGEDDRHMVSYRFDAGDGKAEAPARIWKSLKAGGPLAIRYVPGRPQINHPAAWAVSRAPMLLAYLVGAILWMPAMVFVILIRKQMRLLSEGRPAPGVVTRIKRSDKAVTVYYDFKLLSGASMKGRSSGGRRLAVGSPCCVLYDPENPKRSAIYPLSLVKLAR